MHHPGLVSVLPDQEPQREQQLCGIHSCCLKEPRKVPGVEQTFSVCGIELEQPKALDAETQEQIRLRVNQGGGRGARVAHDRKEACSFSASSGSACSSPFHPSQRG